MKIMFITLMLLTAFACRMNISPEQVQSELVRAMLNHLYQGVDYDSSLVKYRILKVVYYEDRDVYDCEFKVRMIDTRRDTTGYMSAEVSKDFKTVQRNY